LKKYETTFVLDSTLDNDSIEKEIKKVSEVITNSGGNILKSEKWGVKRFAYPIAGKQQGFYTNIVFEGSPKTPPELEKIYKLNEACLRFLTVIHSGEEPSTVTEKKPEVTTGAK